MGFCFFVFLATKLDVVGFPPGLFFNCFCCYTVNLHHSKETHFWLSYTPFQAFWRAIMIKHKQILL